MQIPVLSGIYASGSRPDLGIAMPVNMVPVVLPNGVSNGYLRPADGVLSLKENGIYGTDRGGIAWDGVLYRVIGDSFVSVDAGGVVTFIGNVVANDKPCAFDYGYATLIGKEVVAYLAILSAGHLYYYDKETLQEVTDPELVVPSEGILGGPPIDLIWIDGYFMLTDGTYVYTTELADPFEILPLAYGTTDVDPDPIVALIKLRNEVYVLNRHTIQVLDNVGTSAGTNFAFAPIDGGQVTKGCLGTNACCIFESEVAFLGSGRNEAPAIYLGANANAAKISTVEVDRLLAGYTEAQLASVVLEARNDNAHRHLYVHLPDRTLVFDATATAAFGQAAWSTLTSSSTGFSRYRARSMVWCYGGWYVGDPESNAQGLLTPTTASQWGSPVRWEFLTPIAYNDASGAIFHELELIALSGRNASGTNPTISTSYSSDGVNWSPSKSISAGMRGSTTQRLAWFQQGLLERMRVQRFQGTSDANLSVVRLEARIEPLAF